MNEKAAMTAVRFLLEKNIIPGAQACAVHGTFEKSSISAGYAGIMPEVICMSQDKT
ncbi:hypothetical protein ACE3YI_000414 [Salmonella enterica]